MNKNQKHIDDFFRSKLSDLSLPTHEEDFKAILAGLPAQKKRWFKFWMLLPLLLLIGGLLWWMLDEPRSASGTSVGEQVEMREQFEGNSIENSIVLNQSAEVEGVNADNSDPEYRGPENLNKEDRMDVHVQASPYHPVNAKADAKQYPETIKEVSIPEEKETQPLLSPGGTPSINKYKPLLIGMRIPALFSSASHPYYPPLLPTPSSEWTGTGPIPMKPVLPFTPSLELVTGLNFGMQKVQISENAWPGYEMNKDNERPLPGLNLGINGARSGKHHEFAGGLHYNEFHFTNNRFTVLLFDSIPFLNPVGDTIAWIYKNYRDSVYANPQTLTWRSISVPVTYSYKWALNKKLTLNLTAGLNTSLFIKPRGTSVDALGRAKDGADLYIQPLQFSYLGGIGLRYSFNPTWSLGTNVIYSNALTDSSPNPGLSEIRLRNLNFQMILRYDWYHR